MVPLRGLSFVTPQPHTTASAVHPGGSETHSSDDGLLSPFVLLAGGMQNIHIRVLGQASPFLSVR